MNTEQHTYEGVVIIVPKIILPPDARASKHFTLAVTYGTPAPATAEKENV